MQTSLKAYLCLVVSIPQAVGTVATGRTVGIFTDWGEVSIPQAVGTVATISERALILTAHFVSIPQAVGTVATMKPAIR